MKITTEELNRVPDLSACASAGMLVPREYNILVVMADDPTQVGSIILPDSVQEKDGMASVVGRVVSLSPTAFRYEDDALDHAPKPGDLVAIGKYAGKEYVLPDGKRYRILKDRDVAGVFTHAAA